jgi:putative nucleotidyltransferase with HDIG domain
VELSVENVVKNLQDLPTLPAVVHRLRQALTDQRASAGDIARIITCDVAISAKILKLVNSSYYALEKRVDSIQHAVAYLGFNNVYNLILNLSVLNIFSAKLSASVFKWRDFWHHCAATALTSKIVATQTGYKDIEAAFTAGLLHDLGKVIMGCSFQDAFGDIISKASEEKTSFLDAENKLFKVDHMEVGALASKFWKLPPLVQAAIKHHHTLNSIDRVGLDASKDLVVDIVMVSNSIVQKMGIGMNGSFNEEIPLPEEPIKRLRITKEQMISIKEKVEEQRSLMSGYLGFIGA